jgi:hypothetical protein
VIQTWIARCLITRFEILFGNLLSPTETLSDIIASEFDMNSTRMGTELLMNLEESSYLI